MFFAPIEAGYNGKGSIAHHIIFAFLLSEAVVMGELVKLCLLIGF